MPELPEVEAARRAIEEHCVGKKIRRAVVAADPKVVEGVVPSEFEAALTGKTILAALRKGKNLWLRLDSPPFPSFQFGMTGAFYINGVQVTMYKRSAVKSEDEWPSKYSKVFLELDDDSELSFTDKRRFARVRLLQDPALMPPISEVGPDALLEPMELDDFVKSLSRKTAPIKALLLDQSYIAGIGNWVADEVLYHARIHPLQSAASLTREKCEMLHNCIKQVIHFAVEVDADSSRFPLGWLFHFRWGKTPGKVNGKKIEFLKAGGRTTAYVPELQKIDGTTSDKALGAKSRKTRSVKSPGDDVELDTGEEDESRKNNQSLKSKSKRGRGTSETTRKHLAKKRGGTGLNPDSNEGIEEGKEKEESETDEKLDNRKKSKRVRKATGDAKKAPAKKGTRLNPDEKEHRKNETREQAKLGGQSSKRRADADQTTTRRARKRP